MRTAIQTTAAILAVALAGAAASAQPAAPAATERSQVPAGSGLRFVSSFTPVKAGAWTGKRRRDGQPDVEGHWSNLIANHSNWTDPQAGPPGEPSKQAGLPREQRAPSRVVDPADGQVPYTPAARALQKDFEAHFSNPDLPRYIEPLARCAPAGVPKSFIWHGYEIRQYPGYVVLLFNSGTRIIKLDQSPHLPPQIKLWNADSRGHWEGNTLVVSTTNSNGKALFGRTGDFASENAAIEERFIFDPDGKRYDYRATFTDPGVYTRPWTALIPARRYTEADEPDGWHYEVIAANRPGQPLLNEQPERICVENNGPFGGGAVGVPLDGPIIDR
ncbi:hypothetical protein H7F51_07960 [Novosphingobium flavum]|uniref:Uncharacterized protein n=1 Tax=Novosphingobium flavum TaxID=1778672 RepID=A0A7X1FR78_9SPHN|nr:hypothetical protein [Novosphingobium flavum]MBC2665453.1 hypothetical protein [Novosphingobium flavum]